MEAVHDTSATADEPDASRRYSRATVLRRGAAAGAAFSTLAPLAASARAGERKGPVPGPPYAGGRRGGTGRVVWPDAKVTYDPPLAYDLGGYYGLANFYRGLCFYGPNATPQLDMAESMDVSRGGKQYQFKLKRGLTFHHGREVTAADFKWTLERSSSKKLASWVKDFLGSVHGHKAYSTGRAKGITGIRTAGKYELILDLDQPDVTIPGVLGIPPFYVLPREEVQRLGAQFNFHPVGTGPYRLRSYDKGNNRYTADRFPGYEYANRLPYFDSLDWQWSVAEDLEYLRVKRGDADATGGNLNNALSVVSQLIASKDPSFHQWPSFTLVWFEFDVTRPPFNDKRVRQAFNYAFNKARVKPLQMLGNGHYYPPALFGFSEQARTYGYDPERAKALLKAAGQDNLQITLPILGSSNSGRLEQLVAQDLENVGVHVNLRKDPKSVYDYGTKLQGVYPMWAMSWGMGLPDPAELFNSLIGTGAPTNFGGYSNPTIDRLGRQAQRTTNRAKRGDLYMEIERQLIQDAAFLFVGVNTWATYRSSKLHNFFWEPVLYEYWDRYWVS